MQNQQTALHMAAQQGHGNIVKALLAHGASHDAADSQVTYASLEHA